MPRRSGVPKRHVLPDSKYNSVLVTKIINQVMLDGKKGTAEEIVYGAIDIATAKLSMEPMDLLEKVMENVKPNLEVKARRVGGATYQVPMEIRPERRQTLAIRWLVLYARQRSERTMQEKLAGELVDACNLTGGAVKRKDEMHRAAEANKAFAHFRW